VPALGRLAPVYPCKSAGARRAITLLDLLGELAPALPVTCHLPDELVLLVMNSRSNVSKYSVPKMRAASELYPEERQWVHGRRQGGEVR